MKAANIMKRNHFLAVGICLTLLHESGGAASISDAMNRYGVKGTWSVDCSVWDNPKLSRITYITSAFSNPTIEVHVGKKLVSKGEVTSVKPVTETKFTISTTGYLVESPDKVSHAVSTQEVVGSKRRVISTVGTLPDGRRKVLVRDGMEGYESADGKFVAERAVPYYEKCIN